MIRWLHQLFVPGTSRKKYEDVVREQQKDEVKKYAESQVTEIQERIAYLQAQAAAARSGMRQDGTR